MPKDDFKIAIAGAGPTGLVAACFLQHAGIPFIIFDKKSQPTSTSNAILINARTLQLLKPLGISQRLMQAGIKLNGMAVYSHKKRLASIPTSVLPKDTGMLCLPQAATEYILREYLHEKNITVRQNWCLDKYQDKNDHVMMEISTPEGSQSQEASLLLACDGHASCIRQQAGILYPGHESKSHFVMIDATLQASQINNNTMCAFFHPHLTMLAIPLAANGNYRLIAEVSRQPQFNQIDYPSLEDMQAIAKCCMPFTHSISDMTWSSRFWVHEHLAAQYHKGNIFLLGDAAHCHSPAGGLGMNTGMQDAINLCWKLRLKHKFKAKQGILASYQNERQPVDRQVIKLSSRFMRMATLNNPILYYLRNTLIQLVTKLKTIQKTFLLHNNQLDIEYKNSMLVGKSALAGFTAGTQIADFSWHDNDKNYSYYCDMDPNYFYLLCFENNDTQHDCREQMEKIMKLQQLPLKIIKQNQIRSEPEGMQAPKQGYVLIRPDAYIAVSTYSLQDIVKYCATLLA